MPTKRTDRRPASRAAHSRPSAARKQGGWRKVLPSSTPVRVVLSIALVAVAIVVLFDLAVLCKSIVNANYYSDPLKEYTADLIDAVADHAIAATPDSANDSINAWREQASGRSRWANDVVAAEQYWGLDTSASDLILAIIQVESGGDENVDYIGNIMEVEPEVESYSCIVNGVPEAGVSAFTPQASIYAGTKVVQDALASFEKNYGYAADLTYHPQAALVGQGYNYGYDGWITYCCNAGLTEWNAWAASNYQATVMNGGGSCVYGSRIIEELEKLES